MQIANLPILPVFMILSMTNQKKQALDFAGKFLEVFTKWWEIKMHFADTQIRDKI